jgi:hypothetical protein
MLLDAIHPVPYLLPFEWQSIGKWVIAVLTRGYILYLAGRYVKFHSRVRKEIKTHNHKVSACDIGVYSTD